MNRGSVLILIIFTLFFASTAYGQTNTVTSTTSGTVTVDKTPPTASAPSVVVNNSDVCKSAYSAGVQTQILGIASGVTVTDKNCERLKLSRSLYAMGMKVAAVSALCQDVRIFDAMIMAGTPCPYKGKIGSDALAAWKENIKDVPEGSKYLKEEETEAQEEEEDQSGDTNDPFPQESTEQMRAKSKIIPFLSPYLESGYLGLVATLLVASCALVYPSYSSAQDVGPNGGTIISEETEIENLGNGLEKHTTTTVEQTETENGTVTTPQMLKNRGFESSTYSTTAPSE